VSAVSRFVPKVAVGVGAWARRPEKRRLAQKTGGDGGGEPPVEGEGEDGIGGGEPGDGDRGEQRPAEGEMIFASSKGPASGHEGRATELQEQLIDPPEPQRLPGRRARRLRRPAY
jgi:hypothetical protein